MSASSSNQHGNTFYFLLDHLPMAMPAAIAPKKIVGGAVRTFCTATTWLGFSGAAWGFGGGGL